ncbi:MAG: DUF4270 family protein [Bacteroidales bacterium]
MKQKTVGVRKSKFRFSVLISVVLSVLLVSCEPDNNRLGVDIFPSQDTILVFADTITNLETRLVRSRPRLTSITTAKPDKNRVFLLGSMADTMTGVSKAEIVTEFGLSRIGNFGEEPYIDSLSLWFYVADVIGDTSQPMQFRVYEFLDTLQMNEDYFSDYDVTGKYNPVPLVDEVVFPKAGELLEFKIDNPELLERIRAATTPSDSIFVYNSKFQRNFNGLYITTEPVTEGGSMAKLQLANEQAGLRFKYYHDTIVEIAADTIPLSNYYISFNEYFAQKINIFSHDFTGTSIESLLDNPEAEPVMGYLQGMAGVNVKVSIPNPEEYLDNLTAINTARLVFYIVPDSISGIAVEDYPNQLMMETQLDDTTYIPIYDYVINTNRHYFGLLTQSNKNSAFLDPVYYYSFNIGRHLQSVISGEIENKDMFIFVNNPATTTNLIKFWSNYSGQKGGLRLEIIYTKF